MLGRRVLELVWWRDKGAERGHPGGRRTGQQLPRRESRDPYPKMTGGWRERRGGGSGQPVSVCSLCWFAPPSSPIFSGSLLPPPLSPRQPLGSVWLIKEEEGDTVLSVWARLPRRARGPGQRASSSPLSPQTPPIADISPLPSRKAFYGDETAGLLGRAGPRIRIRLAEAGRQMAAWAHVRRHTPSGTPSPRAQPGVTRRESCWGCGGIKSIKWDSADNSFVFVLWGNVSSPLISSACPRSVTCQWYYFILF